MPSRLRDQVKIVVGLGNPGASYANTPHNVGFRVVECLAGRLGCRLRRSLRFEAHTAWTQIGAERVLLAQPLTFMNASGTVTAALAAKHGIEPSDLIVAVDDADLQVGVVRIREKGGSGGHKGLETTIRRLGTDAFIRVRVGIGRSDSSGSLRQYVLSDIPDEFRELIGRAVETAADAIMCLVESGTARAMSVFNARRGRQTEAEREDARSQ